MADCFGAIFICGISVCNCRFINIVAGEGKSCGGVVRSAKSARYGSWLENVACRNEVLFFTRNNLKSCEN